MKDEEKVTFGNKGNRKYFGSGKVNKNPPISLGSLHLVEGLKFNLLSTSPICDRGNKIIFKS